MHKTINAMTRKIELKTTVRLEKVKSKYWNLQKIHTEQKREVTHERKGNHNDFETGAGII